MRRWPIILPSAMAGLMALGGLMYAGSSGYDCVGRYDNRSVAHPPVEWRWYVVLSAVAVVASFVPLIVGRVRGQMTSPPRSLGRIA